jgi:hypothetical protein
MKKPYKTQGALALNPVSLLISRRFFLAIFFAMIFSFLFFYVLQINKTVYGSYLLEDLQKDFNNLEKENEKLEKSLAGRGSLPNIEGSVSELGFERVSKIYYIQKAETSVASAK